MTLYFGPRPWGAALDDPRALMTDTPIGSTCLRCDESIAEGDSGVLAPHLQIGGVGVLRAQHRECFMRSIVGSVGISSAGARATGATRKTRPA